MYVYISIYICPLYTLLTYVCKYVIYHVYCKSRILCIHSAKYTYRDKGHNSDPSPLSLTPSCRIVHRMRGSL